MTFTNPYELERFVAAQAAIYPTARAELTAGRKHNHWMWFIFPQLAGLGRSAMAQRYALEGLADGRAYFDHCLLGPRLVECTRLMLAHRGVVLAAILPYPDDLKFRSCMTFFAAARPDIGLFQQALDAFCGGKPCPDTLRLLG